MINASNEDSSRLIYELKEIKKKFKIELKNEKKIKKFYITHLKLMLILLLITSCCSYSHFYRL